MSFVGEKWFLWCDGEHRPGLNMAVDDVLMRLSSDHRAPVVRFYGWDRLAVSIGYMQNHSKTLVEGFALVRRPTGGGVVYHDQDFTYSVAVPTDHGVFRLDRLRSYSVINGAVGAGLRRLGYDVQTAEDMIGRGVDRSAMVCFREPTRYDILCEGRKISGSAQRRTAAGLLHQGSIHFDGELPVERQVLGDALVAGFEEKLGVAFAEFANAEGVMVEAERLAAEQYDLAAWNERR